MRVNLRRLCLLLILCSLSAGCNRTVRERAQTAPATDEVLDLRSLQQAIKAVEPLYKRMPRALPDDWLASHKEAGQTFFEYCHSNPVLPDGERHILYVQPLGEFTQTEREIVKITAAYLAVFFNLKVEMRDDLPLALVPSQARRPSPDKVVVTPEGRNVKSAGQLLTSYVLKEVLAPRLPADAAALIAFTAADLYPGEDWNYVFGEASLSERVGVWSLNRLGDPRVDEQGFRTCLRRTLKLATHETGHMFSMQHCTMYECNLSGTNHLGETDRRPLDACPECMAKICWAMKYAPQQRYQRLADFCGEHDLFEEQRFFETATRAVQAELKR